MEEMRRHVRVRMPAFPPRFGAIVIDAKSPSIKCRIVDLSASGACLEISTEAAIPKKFKFVANGSKKTCNLVWQKGWLLGVSW